jgi:hypothetical protein
VNKAHEDARLKELERTVEMRERVYQAAKKRVAGEDQDWATRKEHLERELYTMISAYQGDGEVKAAFILGKAQILARELLAPVAIVEEHERDVALLRALRGRQTGQ